MSSTGKKILFVDDDSDFRRATRKILETGGYEVTEAVNGKDGYEKADAGIFDLIIIDVIMESFSEGFNLISKLVQNEKTRDVPRIIMSTLGIQQELDMIYPQDLGTISILQKPVTKEKLLETVASACA